MIQSLADHNPEPQVTTALDLLLLLNGAGHKHSTAQVTQALFERSGLRFVGDPAHRDVSVLRGGRRPGRHAMSFEEGRVDCCIVGCGPAGAILGLILARAGVDVVVLEKHEDFFRDFRGDAIHPPTLGVLDELGLIDRYFELPVQRVLAMKIVTNEGVLPLADFADPKAKFPYVTYVPQWDFLSLLTDEAKRYPELPAADAGGRRSTCFTDGDDIDGVRYETPEGTHEAPR